MNAHPMPTMITLSLAIDRRRSYLKMEEPKVQLNGLDEPCRGDSESSGLVLVRVITVPSNRAHPLKNFHRQRGSFIGWRTHRDESQGQILTMIERRMDRRRSVLVINEARGWKRNHRAANVTVIEALDNNG